MTQITLNIPDETLQVLKMSPDTFGDEFRMSPAVKFYEMDRLSSGAAAQLAGIPRTVFLSRLADYGVDTFRLTEDERQRETRLA